MKISFILVLVLMITSLRAMIINGQRLGENELPQVQALYGEVNTQLGRLTLAVCSSVLIGPKVLVTAAHCVKKRVSSYFSNPPGEFKKVRRVKKHPKYSASRFNYDIGFSILNDMAIIILKDNLKNIKPISVTNELPKKGDKVIFAGVGLPNRNVRQFGSSTVIKQSTFDVTLRSLVEQWQVADSGDSGGGVFYRSQNGEVKLFAVMSTSTREHQIGPYLPYTIGSVVVSPKLGKENFLEKIVRKYRLKVCGINLNCDPVYF